jgi:hypothetical protein
VYQFDKRLSYISGVPDYSARRFADGLEAIGDGVTGTPIESDGVASTTRGSPFTVSENVLTESKRRKRSASPRVAAATLLLKSSRRFFQHGCSLHLQQCA